CEFLPLFDPVSAFRVDDGDQPDDTAVAAIPIPGKERKGAAAAGDLVEVAADILNPEDAVLEEDPVHRLPFGKILLPIASARPFLVFRRQMRMQRSVTLRPDRGRKWMVVGLRI